MIEKISGIYCIENLINNKKYIGQSKHLHQRWLIHYFDLKNNLDSKHLQNSWNKYGGENFKFYVLVNCPIEDLDELEIFYIKELHSHESEHGYNLNFGGNSNRGLRVTDEFRKKMSIIVGRGENHANFGKHWSEEIREKMSKAKIGKTATMETRKKLSEMRKGTVITEEAKMKLSISQRGKKRISDSKSKYNGVSWMKNISRWMVRINYDMKRIYLGVYKTEEEAAHIYDLKALELYGPNAKLNFPNWPDIGNEEVKE